MKFAEFMNVRRSNVEVHAVFEVVVLSTHVLALRLLLLKQRTRWLEIPVERCTKSHWNIGHVVAWISEPTKGSSVLHWVVEWIERGVIEKHLRRIAVRKRYRSRRCASRFLLSGKFGDSVFFAVRAV